MTIDSSVRDQLVGGIAAMQLTVSEQQIEQLVGYLAELQKWNRVYNLTSIRTLKEMASRHVLDSLSLLPFIVGNRLIDVGTGAGLPGIPVAIMRPDVAVSLLDSNRKKTRFLVHARSHLQLENVTVVHRRVEECPGDAQFSTVTSRAFASLRTFVTQCERFCRADGEIVAMLGKIPITDETASLGKQLLAVEPVNVPGVPGERHIARVAPGDIGTD